MDEQYLFAAIRYVERNPVRAGVAENPWEYPWGGALEFLSKGAEEKEIKEIPRRERTGRPLGRDAFVLVWRRRWAGRLGIRNQAPKAKRNNNSVWCPTN